MEKKKDILKEINRGEVFETKFVQNLINFRRRNKTTDPFIMAALKKLGINDGKQIERIRSIGDQAVRRKIDFNNLMGQQPVPSNEISDVMITTSNLNNIFFSVKFGRNIKIANFGIGKLLTNPELYADLIDAFGLDLNLVKQGFDAYKKAKGIMVEALDIEKVEKYAYNENYIFAFNFKLKAFAIRLNGIQKQNTVDDQDVLISSGLYATCKPRKIARIMEAIEQNGGLINRSILAEIKLVPIEKKPLTQKFLIDDPNTVWFDNYAEAKREFDASIDFDRPRAKGSSRKAAIVMINTKFNRAKAEKLIKLSWGQPGYFYFHKVDSNIAIFKNVTEDFIMNSCKNLNVII